MPAHVVPAQAARAAARADDLTPSFFQVQLGVDMDLDALSRPDQAAELHLPDHDIDTGDGAVPRGNVEEAAYYLYVATFHQPDMAPPGMAFAQARVPDARWYSEGHRLGARQGEDRRHVHPPRRAGHPRPARRTSSCAASARRWTWSRDTGNSDGAFAGWAFVPEMLSRAAAAAAHGRPRSVRRRAVDHADRRAAVGHGLRATTRPAWCCGTRSGREEWQEYAAPVPVVEAADVPESVSAAA